MFAFTALLFVLYFLGTANSSSFSGSHALLAHAHPLHARALASRSVNIFQRAEFLNAHNEVRLVHGAVPLTWSTSLAEKAEQWANQCQFKHTEGVLSTERYGENISAGTGLFTIRKAVGTFTADEDQYDPKHPSYLHFTQVVWKATTQLGCAVAQCDGIFDKSQGKASLYVCLYDPVGNVIGQAPENVQV
ncbi:hypothetical protein D9619_000613 [Psilocybe cf. subviscida]|uniref:SCP domain-containing protein n=1 Tax=Psilocybe cf. subviscida TaxID=2480587 RepID=A0A8H5BEY4_9AGAR|nr:hypothetical protein D9619_000613 [Psilocybe cf. subviscida]